MAKKYKLLFSKTYIDVTLKFFLCVFDKDFFMNVTSTSELVSNWDSFPHDELELEWAGFSTRYFWLCKVLSQCRFSFENELCFEDIEEVGLKEVVDVELARNDLNLGCESFVGTWLEFGRPIV